MAQLCRIRVFFAHGIDVTIDGPDINEETANEFGEWSDGKHDPIMVVQAGEVRHFLNREFLCVLTIEKLPENRR